MGELSEEASREIITGTCPINAGKDAVAMGADNVGGGKQKKAYIRLCIFEAGSKRIRDQETRNVLVDR